MGRILIPILKPSAKMLAVNIMLALFILSAYAQEDLIEENKKNRITAGLDSTEIEQIKVDNSFTFFCDKIIDNDKLLREAKIIFKGKTTTAYSRVIYVASCAGDADLEANKIPDKNYINYLQEYYDELPSSFVKIKKRGKRTKKFVLFKKNKILIDLYIYRPIKYKDTHYILYYILFGRDFKLFYCISLDDDYNVIDYCTRNYTY